MIDDLRAFIDVHASAIPGLGEGKDYGVSTFHHGQGRASKVLFLVTAEGVPVAIAKIMRDEKDNALLEREYRALSATLPEAFKRPAPFGMGEIQGFAVSLEEALPGRVLDASEAPGAISAVSAFARSLDASGSMDAVAALSSIETLETLPARAHELARALGTVPAGATHGDCTFRNIVRAGDTLALIDWSEYGLRPFLHIDLAHYLIRVSPDRTAEGRADFVASYAEDARMRPEEMEFLAYVDSALDTLKKRDRTAYETLSMELTALVRP